MSDVVLQSRPILERFKLHGRAALVTGAGQGIGRAFAHALGEAGAAVAVVDLNRATAEATGDELLAKGIDAIALAIDVTKADQAQAMVDAVVAKWGRLDIAMNNAGMGEWVDSENVTEAQWDRMLDLNLKAVFFCAQAEAKAMLAQGYGKIINTASMSGSIVNWPQHQAAYNISKAGVIHLTRSLAAEWAPRGVRVNCISPGYTQTALVDKLLETPIGQRMAPQWMSRTPMGRFAQVTDLQGAAVFLASEASDFMTGSDVVIDGGYCAW
jgi:NAD(P)-dependent dehydrogenase (short-subunit alcohol dehydrogenase family)